MGGPNDESAGRIAVGHCPSISGELFETNKQKIGSKINIYIGIGSIPEWTFFTLMVISLNTTASDL